MYEEEKPIIERVKPKKGRLKRLMHLFVTATLSYGLFLLCHFLVIPILALHGEAGLEADGSFAAFLIFSLIMIGVHRALCEVKPDSRLELDGVLGA